MCNRCVPYQVLLDEPRGGQNALWAPADHDSCIRAALRFRVGERVTCRVGPDTWAHGTVVAHFHREPAWPEGQYSPYQARPSLLRRRPLWSLCRPRVTRVSTCQVRLDENLEKDGGDAVRLSRHELRIDHPRSMLSLWFTPIP